jgi:molybdopterin converting factor small subunit
VKIQRIVQYKLEINKEKETTVGELIVSLQSLELKSTLMDQILMNNLNFENAAGTKHEIEGEIPVSNQMVSVRIELDKMLGYDLNRKYSSSLEKLAPLILEKYAFTENKNMPLEERRINLVFMDKKLDDNIRPETVCRLLAFEKTTLDQASQFLQPTAEEELEREISQVNEKIDDVDVKVDSLKSDVRWLMSLINK